MIQHLTRPLPASLHDSLESAHRLTHDTRLSFAECIVADADACVQSSTDQREPCGSEWDAVAAAAA